MNNETLKFLLEGQVESFAELSRKNAEYFESCGDAFFEGKKEAYKFASEAFESMIRNCLIGSDTE
jgi:hypothetical protein